MPGQPTAVAGSFSITEIHLTAFRAKLIFWMDGQTNKWTDTIQNSDLDLTTRFSLLLGDGGGP